MLNGSENGEKQIYNLKNCKWKNIKMAEDLYILQDMMN